MARFRGATDRMAGKGSGKPNPCPPRSHPGGRADGAVDRQLHGLSADGIEAGAFGGQKVRPRLSRAGASAAGIDGRAQFGGRAGPADARFGFGRHSRRNWKENRVRVNSCAAPTGAKSGSQAGDAAGDAPGAAKGARRPGGDGRHRSSADGDSALQARTRV